MDLVWININEKLLSGINLTNQISDEAFILLIEYISRSLNHTDDDKNDSLLEKIKSSCQLSNQELSFALKTVSFIFKRASNFIMKPTKLHSDLKNVLKINDNKTDLFMKTWINMTKPILDNLEVSTGKSNELGSITWKLEVQLSSSGKQKEKTALGQINLHTSDKKVINFEMNHDELLGLFDQLENIQTELDLLKK